MTTYRSVSSSRDVRRKHVVTGGVSLSAIHVCGALKQSPMPMPNHNTVTASLVALICQNGWRAGVGFSVEDGGAEGGGGGVRAVRLRAMHMHMLIHMQENSCTRKLSSGSGSTARVLSA